MRPHRALRLKALLAFALLAFATVARARQDPESAEELARQRAMAERSEAESWERFGVELPRFGRLQIDEICCSTLNVTHGSTVLRGKHLRLDLHRAPQPVTIGSKHFTVTLTPRAHAEELVADVTVDPPAPIRVDGVRLGVGEARGARFGWKGQLEVGDWRAARLLVSLNFRGPRSRLPSAFITVRGPRSLTVRHGKFSKVGATVEIPLDAPPGKITLVTGGYTIALQPRTVGGVLVADVTVSPRSIVNADADGLLGIGTMQKPLTIGRTARLHVQGEGLPRTSLEIEYRQRGQ